MTGNGLLWRKALYHKVIQSVVVLLGVLAGQLGRGQRASKLEDLCGLNGAYLAEFAVLLA